MKDYAQHLLKKPFRALAEVKARINAIASQRHPRRQRDDRGLPRPRLTRFRHLGSVDDIKLVLFLVARGYNTEAARATADADPRIRLLTLEQFRRSTATWP